MLALPGTHVYNASMYSHPDAIVLFSGGLDSILAAKLLERQGLSVRCLHFISPFFGSPEAVDAWQTTYNLTIATQNVGEEFVAMLCSEPVHGFGKVLNPCMDCKILLLRAARRYMEEHDARFLATGEVLGQRPMSQRRDALNVTKRDAGVEDILLRPLCAQHLPPTLMEQNGLVDRERLLGLWGRGRTEQLRLAQEWGLADIPTPGGGCRLTERENARRYWPLLTRLPKPTAADFALANLGRQFWRCTPEAAYWLSIGRNSHDNDNLANAVLPGDALLWLRDLPGPLALARGGAQWPKEVLLSAASMAASYAPKAAGDTVPMCIGHATAQETVFIAPRRAPEVWTDCAWDAIKAQLHEKARIRALRQQKKA